MHVSVCASEKGSFCKCKHVKTQWDIITASSSAHVCCSAAFDSVTAIIIIIIIMVALLGFLANVWIQQCLIVKFTWK